MQSELIKTLIERQYILEPLIEQKIFSKTIEKLEIEKKKLDVVKSVIFLLTYQCNFRCPYCFENMADESVSKSNSIITKEMVDAVFNEHYDTIESIMLFGGEPLLLSNREIIEYILSKKKDVEYSIITNGYYLDQYIPLLKEYRISGIEVTLDGLRDAHNSRRYLANGEGTYDQILTGIDAALKENLKITVRMNVDNDNLEDIGQLYDELIKRYDTNANLGFFTNPIFGDSKVCRHDVMEKMLETEKPIKEAFTSSLETYHTILNTFKGKGSWNPKIAFCGAHMGRRVYDPKGDVYTCAIAVGKEKYKLGTYYPKIEVTNDWCNRTINTIESCRQCDKKLICGGGCALKAFSEKGSLQNGDCSYSHTLVNSFIPALYRKYIKDQL